MAKTTAKTDTKLAMTEAENLKLKEETPVLKETDSPDKVANNFEVTFNNEVAKIEAELAAQSKIPAEKKKYRIHMKWYFHTNPLQAQRNGLLTGSQHGVLQRHGLPPSLS